MSEFQPALSELLLSLDIHLSDSQLRQLEQHYELLLKWNKVLNLTGITSLHEAVSRDYAESIFLGDRLKLLPGLGRGSVVLDAGSGAGFPGIPVAVMNPLFRVLLIESHQRKAAFLSEATRGWRTVRVIPKRLEDIDTPCDVMISRAVAWRDIRKSASRVAGGLALLTSAGEIHTITSDPAFVWREPILLPWRTDSVLLLGERSRMN